MNVRTAADDLKALESRAASMLKLRLGVVLAIALAALILLLIATCHQPGRPLPATLKVAVEDHAKRTAAETAVTHRLEQSATVAKAVERNHVARAASLDRHAATLDQRADSATAAVKLDTTAADSARTLNTALTVRTEEVDTLKRSLTERDSALAKADERGDSLAKADSINNARAARADTVIASAVTTVEHSDPPCTFLHFFPCPSRTVVAIGSGALAIVGTIVAIHAVHHIDVAPP